MIKNNFKKVVKEVYDKENDVVVKKEEMQRRK